MIFESIQPLSEQMHRVKVYKLDEAGSWADWGTGHISIQVRMVSCGGITSANIILTG